eukprot:comp21544_c0_seq1/m.47168 comp21544_c0_seq1/g.47168  ORF comp21544_c0_seq1/g.47168 comp21544_c0_seq1/m.47168 type:complete len:338 (-) comp21544_c0_seq1:1247-2260(-)
MSSSKYSWQQTMLRIRDPVKTLPFYVDNFGFTFIHDYHFDSLKFSLYFLAVLPEGVSVPGPPGSPEAEQFLWNFNGTVLELTHNHGSEDDAALVMNNGNVEPNRGFGHIAVNVDDVYAYCEYLEKHGVKFQKKPDDGRMKGLAFALDPDGYWIEILRRGETTRGKTPTRRANLSQTMVRIKDPAKSLPFYKDVFGMDVICERHFPEFKFSLYFLQVDGAKRLPAGLDTKGDAAFDHVLNQWEPVLELTHNHGTESDAEFKYHNGNTEPRGYGHIGFLVGLGKDETIQQHCEQLKSSHNVNFTKMPNDGKIKNIAFCTDPDGYLIELIPRGISISTNI